MIYYINYCSLLILDMLSLSTRQLDLTVSSPIQLTWVTETSLFIVTTVGVFSIPLPTKRTVVDDDMDIMEVSQSQPDILTKFNHPVVTSFIGGDMSCLVVLQAKHEGMKVVTISTVTWLPMKEYRCPDIKIKEADLWVCLLPFQYLPPGYVGEGCVVGGGDIVVILDGGDNHKIHHQCQTRGQFLTQFIPPVNTSISSLASIASILHHQSTGELSSRLLFSSVKDLVMREDMLAILTNAGDVWKMDSKTGRMKTNPLLTCVSRICLVGNILTAVTTDSAVYMMNMMEEEEDVRGRGGELCVRRRGDILENIVEESQKLESVGRDLTIMKQRLEQLQIFQQLLIADPSNYFSAVVTVTTPNSFSHEKCVKVTLKSLSNYKLMGKYWSLKLDLYLVHEKSTQSKTVPLPSSFSGQDTMSCLLPLSNNSTDLPLSVRSHLVFKDEVLLPSIPLLTNQVNILDVLTLSGVGVGSRKLLTAKEEYIQSLGIPEAVEERADHRIIFTVERKLSSEKNNKVEEVLTVSKNISSLWNCLDKTVNICTKSEDDISFVEVTLVGDDHQLLRVIKKEIQEGVLKKEVEEGVIKKE